MVSTSDIMALSAAPRVRLVRVLPAEMGMERTFVFSVGRTGEEADASVVFGEGALVAAMGAHLCALDDVEQRRLHVLLRKEAVGGVPALARALQPRCVPLGFCDVPENASGRCGVRPHVSTLESMHALSDPASPASAPGAEVTLPGATFSGARHTGVVREATAL